MRFTSINGHSLKDDGTVAFGCPVYDCNRCGHSATYGNFTQMDCVPAAYLIDSKGKLIDTYVKD